MSEDENVNDINSSSENKKKLKKTKNDKNDNNANKKLKLDPARVAANQEYDREDAESEDLYLSNLSNEQLTTEFARRGFDINGSNFKSSPESGEESDTEPLGFPNTRNPSVSNSAVMVDTMHVETVKGATLSLEDIQRIDDANTYKVSTGQKSFDPKKFFDSAAWRKIAVWCISSKEMGMENPMTVAELKAADNEAFFAHLKKLARMFLGTEEITSVIERVRNLKLKFSQLDTTAVWKLQEMLYVVDPNFDTAYFGKEKRKELVEVWKVISSKFFKHVLNHRVDNFMQRWIVLYKDDEAYQMPEFLATLNVQMREIPGFITIIESCNGQVTFPSGKGGSGDQNFRPSDGGSENLDHHGSQNFRPAGNKNVDRQGGQKFRPPGGGGVKMLDHLGGSKFSKFWKILPSSIFSTWSRMSWLWGVRSPEGYVSSHRPSRLQ